MNIEMKEATTKDIDKGLSDVFIERYRYHQNGRPDIFSNLYDEELRQDLIKNFEKLLTIILIENNKIVGYLSYNLKEGI